MQCMETRGEQAHGDSVRLQQVVTDYTDVNTENSSVCVYVRARPPDPSWSPRDDDASVEDKFQNPLQATLAGLSPKSNSGGQSATPQATSSAFITNFPDNPKKICIKDPAVQGSAKHHGEIYFSFDRVFWTECSQEEIFQQAVAKPQVENILGGFNGCCFAYGQTGSGKTYSMFGEGAGNSRGMIPRCMEEVFAQLDRKAKEEKEVAVVVSFLEIYCDRVRDLGEAFMSQGHRKVEGLRTTSDVHQQMKSSRAESFQPRNKHGNGNIHPGGGGSGGVWDSYPSMDLKIHEDVQGNVFVKDLSLIPVTTLEEVLEIISLGLKVRATHETKMNQVSSRSHTVFTVTVVQKDPYTDETTTGMLNLVDLAGSERLKKSASEGQRKTEALHINSSLTALGKVVMALDPSSGLTHIPYRDSKLTRLLQNSLGGNSFTVVLATVHPIARRSRLGNGGLGADGPGGVSAEANSRVLAVLAQMGLADAMQLPNGSIRLPDGRIVGNFGLDGEGSGGDASNSMASVGGPGGGGGRGAYASGILKGVPPGVRTMVQGLEGEVRGLKKKLKERKKEVMSTQAQLEARRAVFVESEKESKRRETELAEQLAVVQAQLSEVRAAAARTKEDQLNTVLAGSQSLLKRQRRMLLNATGQCCTEDGEVRAQDARERKAEAHRHAQSLRALEFSKEVETENLRQQCEQLVQAEAEGRALTKTKLDNLRARRDREVRELSVELLLLHDHALSLHETIRSADLTPSSSCEAIATLAGGAGKISTEGQALVASAVAAPPIDEAPAAKDSPPPVQPSSTLLQSVSLPCLSRLLEARGAAAPTLTQGLDGCHRLSKSRSGATFVQDGGGDGAYLNCDDKNDHLRSTTTTAKRTRTRPASAGVVKRGMGTSGTVSPSCDPGLARGAGKLCGGGVRPVSANRVNTKKAVRSGGARPEVAKIRPVSAPGRRLAGTSSGREGLSTLGDRQHREKFKGPIGVDVRGGSSTVVAGRGQTTLLGGWSAQDVMDRPVGELSRGGLFCIVRALREKVRAADGSENQGVPEVDEPQEQQQQQTRQCRLEPTGHHAAPILGAVNGAEVAEERGRPDMPTQLREQTRRYNDLRVAYESLCRRLDKSRGHADVFRANGGNKVGAKAQLSGGRGNKSETKNGQRSMG
ncbi:unnamed protein product [Ectocarpus sp. 8 AP-2014]